MKTVTIDYEYFLKLLKYENGAWEKEIASTNASLQFSVCELEKEIKKLKKQSKEWWKFWE